jgi:glycolate oxidase FAD binding subunit
MRESVQPEDAKAVAEAVQWALSARKTLDVAGRASKRAVGRPIQTDLTLDLSAMTGVTLYEPEELVLSARAATPLAEIEALLDSKGQQLAFEPMDCGPILGGAKGAATIGGTLAANLSGPRRITAGAARDHFLGFVAVSGRGEIFKSGGRVVKNVTGYDLCKLMAGSWGTLAAMTEITIKTLPKPENEHTVLIHGLEPADAVAAMTAAMGSGCDVSGAAHWPAWAAARAPVAEVAQSGAAVTALRLEGFAASVAHRKQMLQALLRRFGQLGDADAEPSRALWQAVRNAAPFTSDHDGSALPLWRLSVPASRGGDVAAQFTDQADCRMLLDWAGGLIWLAIDRRDAGASMVRRALDAAGGHATLMRAEPAVRAAVEVFSSQDPGVAALTKRVKESFDPLGVLNPGRMWVGV